MSRYDTWKLQAPPDDGLDDQMELCTTCRYCVDADEPRGAMYCVADYSKRGAYSITRIAPFYEPCAEREEA